MADIEAVQQLHIANSTHIIYYANNLSSKAVLNLG